MPNYRKKIRRSARKYGVDPNILEAQLRQESGLRMGLTSSAGAQDIAQFMPATAKQYGVTLGDGRAADDIDGAARYMRDNLKRTGGDYKQALSIYNSGRPDAYKDPSFANGQTYNYVKKIMSSAGTSAAPQPRSAAPSYQTVTSTTPGVDNSGSRQQLQLSYLQNRGNPNALLDLASGLKGAQDVAPTTTSRQVKTSAFDPAGNDAVQVMKAAAEKIDQAKVPYQWGGGHSKKQKQFGPVTALDCSGAVSRVLGIDPMVSGDLAKWGRSGKGKRVTVYANGTHTLMEIDGKVFGTSAQNPGGGAGWIPKSYFPKGYFSNFSVRHPPGM